MDFKIGNTLNLEYDLITHEYIIHDIKFGGMGTVFLLKKQNDNWHTVFRPMVAVKTIKENILTYGNTELFEKELNIWIGLNHPNILPLRALLPFQNHLLAVMPICKGNIRDLVTNDSINKSEVISLIKQITHGLDYAYKVHNILHLDIKPENVLIDFNKKGTFQITDWGIANIQAKLLKSMSNDSDIISTCSNFGTLMYMSPERLLGAHTNIKFDIYSIGLMLYELMAHCSPFTSNSNTMVYHQIVNGDYFHNITSNHRNIDKKIMDIIIKCVNPDCSRRYSDYADLTNDLVKVEKKSALFSMFCA